MKIKPRIARNHERYTNARIGEAKERTTDDTDVCTTPTIIRVHWCSFVVKTFGCGFTAPFNSPATP